jgi:hypothetical protein
MGQLISSQTLEYISSSQAYTRYRRVQRNEHRRRGAKSRGGKIRGRVRHPVLKIYLLAMG